VSRYGTQSPANLSALSSSGISAPRVFKTVMVKLPVFLFGIISPQRRSPVSLKLRICLVVDDMPVTRRLYGLLLQKIGFAMVEAGSVEEALSAVSTQMPELAIVDWNLPDQDGVEFVKQLRKMDGGKDVKVIMNSVETGGDKVSQAVMAGADRYVYKGISIDDFIFEIRELKLI